MISEKQLSEYGFETIEEYFEYILDSKTNGQHTQARELFKGLSQGMQGQRANFFEWAETTYYYDAMDSDEMDELGMLKNYFSLSKLPR